ncbi:MAG: saccharopine dehydrogenase family protein [Terricaulis sp.]
MTSLPPLAVYGAYGHTGKFVVRELLRRNLRVIASGRDLAKLEALRSDFPGIEIRHASLQDPAGLDSAFLGCGAVLNCAGPFLDTAAPVIDAALRGGFHYLDIAAEQAAVFNVFNAYDDPARAAGVLVAPSLAFYGGLADLLTVAALGEWSAPSLIEIAVALDSWAPTLGTRRTGERNTGPRLYLVGGVLEPNRSNGQRDWRFAPPFGDMLVANIALAETVSIARHVPTQEVRLYLSANALADLSDESTPPPAPVDESGRSAQRFLVDVRVHGPPGVRCVRAHGRDIYAISAPIVAEAGLRLLRGEVKQRGARSAGQLFEPRAFLSALGPDWLTVDEPEMLAG